MPTSPSHTLDELATLGGEIFDRQVRPALKPADNGKYVAIDVTTGDYEIDEDAYTAIARMRLRKPGADTWLMRAGYRAAYRTGLRTTNSHDEMLIEDPGF
jgi:hypothetical protein